MLAAKIFGSRQMPQGAARARPRGNSSPPDADLAAAAAREAQRLSALDHYDVLDTPREQAFDSIARLTRKLLGVPIALVSVLDAHRQWYKAAEGVSATEAPRQDTFCRIAIEGTTPLLVEDATADPRFSDNPYVTGAPGIRAYAGIPLRTSDGHNIGTLCAVDTERRRFSADQIEALTDLARLAMDELELRRIAATDVLTGAMSRRAFKAEADRAVALALRHHHDVSCILLDLDHFKSVNDTHGHAAGDAVLVKVLDACRDVLRGTDLVGRLGGEEFAVLLPQTSLEAAMDVGEKLRRAIGDLTVETLPDAFRITASFGVASLDLDTRDLTALLAHADVALYRAKSEGRNRVVAWQASEAAPTQQRRRVLKGGTILFNDRNSTVDCTVRSLSDDGAGLDVISSVGIPKTFDLAIRADGLDRPCRVTARTEKHIELEFL
jgi:diguanylate cyclase (GGDEF)-like protein